MHEGGKGGKGSSGKGQTSKAPLPLELRVEQGLLASLVENASLGVSNAMNDNTALHYSAHDALCYSALDFELVAEC